MLVVHDYGYLKDDNGTDDQINVSEQDDYWKINYDSSDGKRKWYQHNNIIMQLLWSSGSSQNNIDQTNVSRTGITYNSDVES